MQKIKIDNTNIGESLPVYFIAEIGINHNGDINIAKKLIDLAVLAGANAVKFQKRNPEMAVPKNEWDNIRDTPWGKMSYIDYKRKIEFGKSEYKIIDQYCKEKGITWFASVWDEDSVDFLEKLNVSAYKIPSACLTDFSILKKVRATNKTIIMSTGMSTIKQIDLAINELGGCENLILMHAVSTYPSKINEINLKFITKLKEKYCCPVGYSGHEIGIEPTYASIALGVCVVERHITLDRCMWGTDQGASLDSCELIETIRGIRRIEMAMGTGNKEIIESELPVMKKLRRKDDTGLMNRLLDRKGD